jgi:beta-glucosidase
MGAFGRAGATFCNANIGLQTGIAREEWGWTGYMVTDMVNPAYYMNFTDTLWGGADGMLTTANDGTYNTNPGHWLNPEDTSIIELVKKDQDFQAKLQTSMRRLLWAELNSNLMNGKAGAGHTEYYTTWYDALLTGLTVGGFVIAGIAAVGFLALTFVPGKKEI